MYNISMPKNKDASLSIDLLKPQSEPKKIPVILIQWVLSAGRYLIVFVEILVLAAFLSRFKLDSDISDLQEEIDAKIPFIQSSVKDEVLYRTFQGQISNIKELKLKRAEYLDLINGVAIQTPSGVTLSNVTFNIDAGKLNIKITGVAQNNDQLASLVYGLRSDETFQGVNLASVSLEQGLINFSLTAQAANQNKKDL